MQDRVFFWFFGFSLFQSFVIISFVQSRFRFQVYLKKQIWYQMEGWGFGVNFEGRKVCMRVGWDFCVSVGEILLSLERGARRRYWVCRYVYQGGVSFLFGYIFGESEFLGMSGGVY